MLETHQKLVLQIIGVVFIDIKNDDFLRMEIRDLPAQLRADRTAAACYQYGFPLQIPADLLHVQMNFITAKQIQNINITDRRTAFRFIVTLKKLIQSRQSFEPASRFGTDAQDILLILFICIGNGKENLINIVANSHSGNAFPAADHLDAMNPGSALGTIVVDRNHRDSLAFRSGFHIFDDHGAHFARPDYHDALKILRLSLQFIFTLAPVPKPDGKTSCSHKEEHESPSHHINRNGKPVDGKPIHRIMSCDGKPQNGDQNSRDGSAIENLQQLVHTGKLPHCAVKTEKEKHDQRNQEHERNQKYKVFIFMPWNSPFKSKLHRDKVTEKDTYKVYQYLRNRLRKMKSLYLHPIAPVPWQYSASNSRVSFRKMHRTKGKKYTASQCISSPVRVSFFCPLRVV